MYLRNRLVSFSVCERSQNSMRVWLRPCFPFGFCLTPEGQYGFTTRAVSNHIGVIDEAPQRIATLGRPRLGSPTQWSRLRLPMRAPHCAATQVSVESRVECINGRLHQLYPDSIATLPEATGRLALSS
jgi:hypothetical protein